MTVPYMKKPDSDNDVSLALVNNELRKRLFRAAKMIQEKNAENKQLREGVATTVAADPAPQDDDAILRSIYGYEGTEEYLKLTGKIDDLESELHKEKLANTDLKEALDKTLKGAEMKEAELREIVLGVRTETRKKDRTVAQLKKSLRRMSDVQEGEGLSHQLTVSAMHVAGLEAQLSTFRKTHPSSELMQPGTDSTDSTKSRLRVIYENAFDAKGIELGVTNPSATRTKQVKSPT